VLVLVLVVVVVLVLVLGCGSRRLGWNTDERRKQTAGVSLVAPEKQTRTKYDDEEDEHEH
jgi:hypothetical protein